MSSGRSFEDSSELQAGVRALAPSGDRNAAKGRKRARPKDGAAVATSVLGTGEEASDLSKNRCSTGVPFFPAIQPATNAPPGLQQQADSKAGQHSTASTSNHQLSNSRMVTGGSSSLIDHLRSRPHQLSTPAHHFAPGARNAPVAAVGLSQEQRIAILQGQRNELLGTNANIDNVRQSVANQNTLFGRASQGQSNQRQPLSDESILAARLAEVQHYHGLLQLFNAANTSPAMLNSLWTAGAPIQQNPAAQQQPSLLESLLMSNHSPNASRGTHHQITNLLGARQNPLNFPSFQQQQNYSPDGSAAQVLQAILDLTSQQGQSSSTSSLNRADNTQLGQGRQSDSPQQVSSSINHGLSPMHFALLQHSQQGGSRESAQQATLSQTGVLAAELRRLQHQAQASQTLENVMARLLNMVNTAPAPVSRQDHLTPLGDSFTTLSAQDQSVSNRMKAANAMSPFSKGAGVFDTGSATPSTGSAELAPPELPTLAPDGFLENLPAVLFTSADKQRLSSHQVFLRQQIEAFRASEADIRIHKRGRNKPIVLNQVGIRCRHCAHIAVEKRQKGSTYFPATCSGIYQASQNMNTMHLQCGLCSEMPEEVRHRFSFLLAVKGASLGAGRPYWEKAAKEIGLVDTPDGIRFFRDTLSLPGGEGKVAVELPA